MDILTHLKTTFAVVDTLNDYKDARKRWRTIINTKREVNNSTRSQIQQNGKSEIKKGYYLQNPRAYFLYIKKIQIRAFHV